jgi:rhomboid protease GluP
VADRVHRPALTRNARSLAMQIGILIVANLVIGFSVRGIDNAAHIGGLLAGCWLGLVMVPRGATTLRSFWSGTPGGGRRARLVGILGAIALLALVAAAVVLGPFTRAVG